MSQIVSLQLELARQMVHFCAFSHRIRYNPWQKSIKRDHGEKERIDIVRRQTLDLVNGYNSLISLASKLTKSTAFALRKQHKHEQC